MSVAYRRRLSFSPIPPSTATPYSTPHLDYIIAVYLSQGINCYLKIKLALFFESCILVSSKQLSLYNHRQVIMLSKQGRLRQRKAEARLRQKTILEKSARILVKSSVLTPSSEVVERFREASLGKYVRWRNVNGRVNIE